VTPVGALPPQPWMAAPETAAVLAALAPGGPARFVGGCVRDAVLGRAVKDIDIATAAPPERVMALVRAAGLKAIPTGIEHGTVTAVVGDTHFEVTTLRRDVETFGRRARVAFTDDWAADAARRDFTINALYCDPDGTLYDPTGGLADLRAGRVRFVGDAQARIAEDVLRLLRFFRFHAYYGRGRPDRTALAACRAAAPKVKSLSGERVRSELFRLLLADHPQKVLEMMARDGVLDHVLPELTERARLGRLSALEDALGLDRDTVRRLAAGLAAPLWRMRTIAARLRLSNAERDRLVALAGKRDVPTPDLDDRARRRMVYRQGLALFQDRTLVAWASEARQGKHRNAAWLNLFAAAALEGPPSRLPVAGRDVRALGVAQGPEVGQLLAAVERWWISRDFRPDRAECLARLAVSAEKRRATSRP
jgi:poly(A) polymerase